MADEVTKLSKKAEEIILSFPKSTRIRVVSHYDADGISSAGIICKALYRAGFDFHATLMRNPFDKGLERISKEDNELIIFCDMGSGMINEIEEIDCKSVIIDHHQFLKEKISEKVLQINANLCGINGNYDACASTLSFYVAIAMDPKNEDLVNLAFTGATGDKQYIGDFKGFNKKILDDAISKGFLKEKVEIKLSGKIQDALYYSVDPYYSGISGNKEKISEILKKMKINGESKFEELDSDKKKQLQSFLMLQLVKKGCEKNILDTVIRPRYNYEELNCELESLADLLDSCGKGGNRGLGLAICMGDKVAFEKALELEKEYKQKILENLMKLEKEGFKERKGFRYFISEDSSLGGAIAGIAANFILDKEKALISIVKKNDELHVSCRGNQHLVARGLDLSFAMNEAASKLGGYGGGHKIAAGATIRSDKENEFLDIVDEIIVKQLKE